ncbi:MAG TPA: hypothetical protein VK476_03890 [Flavobacterium sp.]|nr:hypothetical protein [Flavobacterium sp.]
MKKAFLILLLFPLLFSSCQYFDKQVPSKDALLEEQLKTINWKTVDELPSISNCDSLTDKSQKQQCFFEFLTQLIQQKLNSDTLAVLYPELDTINVKVTVFANAALQFEPQFKDTLSYNTAKIDSIIVARLVDFPQIKPALKRGLPVKTQFILPVILKVE